MAFVVPEGCLLNAGSEAAASQSVYACWQALTLTPIVFSKMMYASAERNLITGQQPHRARLPQRKLQYRLLDRLDLLRQQCRKSQQRLSEVLAGA